MSEPLSFDQRCALYARQQKRDSEEDRLRQERDAQTNRRWEQSQAEKQEAVASTQAASNAQITASEEAVHRHYGPNAVKTACADLCRMQREHPERYAAVRRKAYEMGVLLA